ncbi:MAG: HD-GYP domain-containing protein [Methylocystaceae bacterium]
MRVNKITCIVPGLMVMVTGAILVTYNQSTFMDLAQMFMVVIGFLAYFLAIHTNIYSRDTMLIFLGRAYIGIALLHLWYLISPDLAFNTGYNGSEMILVGSRLIEAMALLFAPFFVRCRPRSQLMQLGTLALGLLIILVLSGSGLLTARAVAWLLLDNSSLTEYLILFLLLLAIPHLLNCAQLEEHPAYYLLALMVGLMAVSEVAFILGGVVGDFRAFFYLLRLLAYYIFLFVLLTRGIKEPYERLHHAYEETLYGWGQALEMRDWETGGHCRRVAELTARLASRCGIRGEKLVNVYRGALLHDIGKLAVPDHVLLKEGGLSAEEWVLMRRHPDHAVSLLGRIAFLSSAIDIPACHHEKWDGSGYPNGLSGEEIPLSARIFALVDVWDALSHDRPYRRAWETERIYNWMQEQAGSHFDPVLTQVFIDYMQEQKAI